MKFKNSFKTFALLGALLVQQFAFAAAITEQRNSAMMHSSFKGVFNDNYELLINALEAKAEGNTFFNLLSDHNTSILNDMFVKQEETLAVSIGSSSTQYYYLDGGEIVSNFFRLGTDDFSAPKPDSDFRIQKFIDEHMAPFQGSGKTIVLFNSAGYLPKAELAYYWMLNGQTEAGFMSILGDEGAEAFSAFAHEIIETTGLRTYLKNRNMKPKLDNTWALGLAGDKDFVIDIGGGSATLRLMKRNADGVVVSAKSLAKIKIKANEILTVVDEAAAQAQITKFVMACKKALSDAGATPENFMIRQTGQIRDYSPELMRKLEGEYAYELEAANLLNLAIAAE